MLFSASEAVFYDPAHEASYREAGSWPSDLVTVTADVFEQFGRAGPPIGKRLSSGRDGQPCWVDVEPESPDTRRKEAINWLDATADRVRASDRSVGQYLDAEYQLVAQALIEYRNNPDDEVPDAIQSYAAAEGLTVEAAAQQIAEAAARVQELLQDVRRIRLAGKGAIRDASDDADFMETARPFIDQLEALTGAE